MADSKFSYVRALVQDGSLTNLATASPWTVTHPGGSGVTMTATSRIAAESGPIGRSIYLCAEAVVSLDGTMAGSTVLSCGRGSIVVNSSGQLGCMLDGVQFHVFNISLSSQRVFVTIELGPNGAWELYFFRANGESSGLAGPITEVVPNQTYPVDATSKVVVGGLLIDTVQASPAQGTVNVSTTRPGVLSAPVPHIVAIDPVINLLDGRTAPSTGGSVTVTAERGSSSVTYTIPNTAGMSINSLGAALAAGIASQIGGTASTSGGKTYITTAANEDNQNWFIWFNALGLSYPAEPPVWGPSVAGGSVFSQRITQSGVYGVPGGSVTQRDVISLTLPAANADVNLSVSLQPTLNAAANMGNIATGLDSLVAQIAAAGFTASWQQIGAGQYVISTERLTPGAFTLVASLTVGASSVPNPVTTLHAMRVTTAARYTAVGGVPDAFPSLPWPTTSIPGSGGAVAPTVWDATYDADLTYTNGSRTATGTASQGFAKSVFGAATGLWYFEVTLDAGNIRGMVGVGSPGASPVGSYPGDTGTDIIALYRFNDSTYSNGTVDPIGVTPGDVIGVLFDASAMTVRWKLDSSTLTTAVGIPGTGPVHAIFGSGDPSNSVEGTLNSGQVAFVHGLPVGANPVFGDGSVWGTLPADVIFAVNAEANANDVAQFGLAATASGTATIQASGSRTSDGYLRNTDSAQMADACFGYTPSSGFQAAWGAAQSMTLEFDIKYETGGHLGGQILGIGNGYSSLSDNGPSGIAITGSPFAAAVGSATLTPGAWHHIAFVADYNGGSRVIRTYRDGVQQDTPQSVLAFWFNDYPTPTEIGLLQMAAGFIGNGALKGGMDNIVLTTRAKYSANFIPGVSFPEIVGYTPPPSNVDVTAAGYNDLDTITGAGTFNTQLTPPDAYFFSVATLDDFGGAGNAYTADGNSINFTGARTLANTTCTGTFVRGTPQNFSSDVALDGDAVASTFYCDVPVEWTGSSTIDDATNFGLMMFLAPATFTGESVADDAYGITSGFEATTPPSANATVVLPAVTVAARTGHKAAAVMPTPFVTSSATTRSPAGSVLTLPSLTAVVRGGHRGAATLPALTVSAQVTTTQMLRAQVTLPALTVVSTARVSGQGAVQSYVPALSAAAQGGHQARAQLPGLSATAHVVSGVTARVQGVLPKITAYATGYREDTMRATVNLPALVVTTSGKASIALPRLSTASFGQPVVTAAHEAYVVNMNQPLDDNPRNNFESKNEQVTRYTNWPFFQVVRLGNAYYGVAEDGLYELGGATDNGTAIAWNFETCKTDFKDPHRKAVASAYIGGQAGPELTYTLRSGDDTDRMYDYITTKTVQKRNHRQKFGLGRRVRYYSFGLAGEGTAAIDSIEFELLTTTRRV